MCIYIYVCVYINNKQYIYIYIYIYIAWPQGSRYSGQFESGRAELGERRGPASSLSLCMIFLCFRSYGSKYRLFVLHIMYLDICFTSL